MELFSFDIINVLLRMQIHHQSAITHITARPHTHTRTDVLQFEKSLMLITLLLI